MRISSGTAAALTLAALCAASALTPTSSFGQSPRYRPTNAECTAGYAPDTVFLHACDNDTTYFCPRAGAYGWDTMCVPLSDAQLADRRDQKARELEQQRLAREQAQRRQALIDEKVKEMGPGRRAEAETFVDMKLAADAARPKPKTEPACRMVKRSWTEQVYSNKSLEAAQAQVPAWQARACKAGRTCGPVKCGWSGMGPVAAQVGAYICKMDVSGEEKVCDRVPTTPSKVTSQ